MSFQKILNKYRKISFSEKDKGDRFERLMQAYLQTDPKYAYRFKNVWQWKEFYGRKDLGGGDTGIDLVALTHEGDYWAIQCKCQQEDSTINKPAVDSFLSTSSKEFKDDNMQTTKFAHRLWISTTNKWGKNATEAIKNQSPPVTRINLNDLQEAPVDWEKLDKGIHGEASRAPRKTIRPHQKEALEKTHEYFKTADRGKLIMACGTGKTFNTLRIAEHETDGKGFVLFLVPSIALLGQTLREWSADAIDPINAICICSDPDISRKRNKSKDAVASSIVDLALPASTNEHNILNQFRHIKTNGGKGLTVVFSTYQSIEVIARTQKELLKNKNGYGEFDLIICDEAHRTTGVTLTGDDESAFVKVHDNNFIKAKKRLYMTATPRLYSDDTKSKAAQADAILCSMDDPELYGEEIYRIGFGEAVERDLLTDYKVLILTLSENDVPPAIQKMIADKESEINTDDASKLIGCINALSKQILGDEGVLEASDPDPMKRAVAFCSRIVDSKKITSSFNSATKAYIGSLPERNKKQMVSVASKHIDGTMTAPERDELLAWLKDDMDENESRILTNVRCLSEGVDVPSLDAVMFLSARNSQVDVVQSVGRVMRKSPGKKYGYIIIPVVVPADVEAAKALDNNERYKVVWTVLNALRAHDDRFNATVNKIELNRKRPDNILIGKPNTTLYDDDGFVVTKYEPKGDGSSPNPLQQQMMMQFEQLQDVMFARMVLKVGDRRYWEQWAKNVAEIAERQVDRINRLLQTDGDHRKAFENFLGGLQKNINPSISKQEAVDMLSQHIITQPVFEALFEDYSFVKNNPISKSMQSMLDTLEGQALEKDTETLDKFYESVKKRAEGIDNAEGKQRIIIELYDKFFKTAFPKMVEKLGIVYTPVEVVDYVIHSIEDVLQKEFNRSFSDENIHILDPFTGTGTFVTRLLQSGLIDPIHLKRKYTKEIHANELVLLAYYIAAVNIENAYHDLADKSEYIPFEGICLTDTFQLGETEESEHLISEVFPQNSKRVRAQKKAPLRVIMGNPPYSVGQKSANDNAQNQAYPKLDARIAGTYAANTNATLKNSLYDSYIKAFRWSTDRLDPKNGGVIAFVTNGSWLDGNAQDGFRKCLVEEFSAIYVFNLRGNQRTSGETSRREGGKIFGSGSRTPVAITLLVKKPGHSGPATIHYHDIGDYLKREDKLALIQQFQSAAAKTMPWQTITPDQHNDWLNKRNSAFESYIPLGDKKDKTANTVFVPFYSNGVKTNRDSWCYNFSWAKLSSNMKGMIGFYNGQMQSFLKAKSQNRKINVQDYVDGDETKIGWTRGLRNHCDNGIKHAFKKESIAPAVYRPFSKQRFYSHREFIETPGKSNLWFPTLETENLVICVSGTGGTKELSTLMTNILPDYELVQKSQCFPLYYYEEATEAANLFGSADGQYVRCDGLTDFIRTQARERYGKRISKEDIFYYVYGLLHSLSYRETFSNDLKKTLPRIPLIEEIKTFWAFSKAGRELAELHVNYESVPPHSDVIVEGGESKNFRVEKMRFPKKDQKETIIYNSKITLSNIPAKAYDYVVNGKSAIEWIMERYQIKVDKKSGIKNDPNDWAKEVDDLRYILDLLLSIINVSTQTVDIVNGLPKMDFSES